MAASLILELLLLPAALILPGFLFARRLRAAPLEQLLAAVVFACLGAYLLAFGLYLLRLPPAWFGLWAAAGAAAALLEGRHWRAFASDAEVRACLGPWVVVGAWEVGALVLIHHYSGGAWAGDWIEHFHRAMFFLYHWPFDYRFLEYYALPARPPLANLVVGGLMALTGRDYAHFQLGNTLFNTLAFLPAAALVRHFTKARSAPWLLALLWMLNPMMLQNATLTWTKQSTACFVLTGLWFLLRGRATAAPWRDGLAFLALGTGAVCHYSTGPYLVAAAGLYLVLERRQLRRFAGWRRTAGVAAGGVAVIATWAAWALWRYGVHGTLLSNSTATYFPGAGPWLRDLFLNVWCTLVPQSPWRLDNAVIFGSTDPVAVARDYYFGIYQTNFLWAIGSGAWLALLWLAIAAWRARPAPLTAGLSVAAAGAWALGVFGLSIVATPFEDWGVAQGCLQPLVMLALVGLAVGAPALPPLIRRALVLTTAVDFLLGSALHLAVEHRDYRPRLLAGEPLLRLAADENLNMRNNIRYQLAHGMEFIGDRLNVPAALVAALLALLLVLVAIKWRQARAAEAAAA
ncbi:MAG TPA: hypothetical protein VMD31_08825 [Opitutaceae bacterium]|nr:hypothetical protein [Opitutaceae bacterium]